MGNFLCIRFAAIVVAEFLRNKLHFVLAVLFDGKIQNFSLTLDPVALSLAARGVEQAFHGSLLAVVRPKFNFHHENGGCLILLGNQTS